MIFYYLGHVGQRGKRRLGGIYRLWRNSTGKTSALRCWSETSWEADSLYPCRNRGSNAHPKHWPARPFFRTHQILRNINLQRWKMGMQGCHEVRRKPIEVPPAPRVSGLVQACINKAQLNNPGSLGLDRLTLSAMEMRNALSFQFSNGDLRGPGSWDNAETLSCQTLIFHLYESKLLSIQCFILCLAYIINWVAFPSPVQSFCGIKRSSHMEKVKVFRNVLPILLRLVFF